MKRISIGGQAVLEGIMMKGPESYSLAVRKEDGEIALELTPYISFGERKKLNRIPIVRGVVNFIESLYIGMKTLMASSEYFLEEDEEDAKADKKAKKAAKQADNKAEEAVEAKADTVVKTEAEPSIKTEEQTGTEPGSAKAAEAAGEKKSEKKEDSNGMMIIALIISLVFAIGVFILLPSYLSNLLYKVTTSDILVNTCEGVLRLVLFLLYIILISLTKDVKRTFMYHGAEHKTINCLEAGDELTPENVLKHTRFHKRCGTSFVFIVMIISILAFMFIHTDTVWLRMLSRLLLIPVIAGLSYEVIRYAGLHQNACSRIMSAPGLWVQRITTKEPDLQMAEVAIKAVEAVVDWREYIECVRNDSFEK